MSIEAPRGYEPVNLTDKRLHALWSWHGWLLAAGSLPTTLPHANELLRHVTTWTLWERHGGNQTGLQVAVRAVDKLGGAAVEHPYSKDLRVEMQVGARGPRSVRNLHVNGTDLCWARRDRVPPDLRMAPDHTAVGRQAVKDFLLGERAADRRDDVQSASVPLSGGAEVVALEQQAWVRHNGIRRTLRELRLTPGPVDVAFRLTHWFYGNPPSIESVEVQVDDLAQPNNTPAKLTPDRLQRVQNRFGQAVQLLITHHTALRSGERAVNL